MFRQYMEFLIPSLHQFRSVTITLFLHGAPLHISILPRDSHLRRLTVKSISFLDVKMFVQTFTSTPLS